MVGPPATGWVGVGRGSAAVLANTVGGYGSGANDIADNPKIDLRSDCQNVIVSIDERKKRRPSLPSPHARTLLLMPSIFKSLTKLIGLYLDELSGGVLRILGLSGYPNSNPNPAACRGAVPACLALCVPCGRAAVR